MSYTNPSDPTGIVLFFQLGDAGCKLSDNLQEAFQHTLVPQQPKNIFQWQVPKSPLIYFPLSSMHISFKVFWIPATYQSIYPINIDNQCDRPA